MIHVAGQESDVRAAATQLVSWVRNVSRFWWGWCILGLWLNVVVLDSR